MATDWRVLAVGLLMALGGGFIGFEWGHYEGVQDSDGAAMSKFFDKCVVPDPPGACQAMFDAIGYNITTEPQPNQERGD